MRSRGIPARRESVVHPRSLNSGDFALGFYHCLLARSSQRLSQWHGQNDYGGVLHAAYAEPSGACLLKYLVKPAANDDLFRKLHSRCQGTDSAMAGRPGKMSSRLASETLSLEPRFFALYTIAVTVQPNYATLSEVEKTIDHNCDDVASLQA